ncbi:electron transfer flavoprotein subunit beta/FixA family protein [Actinosynnema pretiosum subsp. pretiosum]|uniref:Electron transfer flavoprotein subunit beta n=2 Tax=Actinosynnema TaxID=40566 RepID=C6WG94_ACTMD|nr:electron transfer flavoprotein subunit beta/FixA family protein [Actinosynnema mirum]ACU39858.1 Electron transfer flavoprotein alpha/beta- subunit [Actinosynnema mirum DSM 43827]AXX33373.1 Electron transfer flavoprotein, beta subunit [Actinosynnema pretiosum subsp. pretiosum]QUF02810.1 electron transfer flavoprotein subunit beta/FixA family protein [Actinosynnema pretiosum subsp. pretiosum]
MNIVVLVKQVPDTWSERKLSDADHTLDRDAADAVLDEINERAVEEALVLQAEHGGEVTVLSMGPDRATDAIRKALSMGADKAIHVSDPALHGSDALTTAKVLAKALATVEFDLVVAGNEATDGRAGAVPAILAELLGLPQLTHVRKVTVEGGVVKAVRETDEGVAHLEASLPAVLSVNEKINEPRYPSFKGIMAAKKKPVTTLTASDLGLGADEVGLGAAWTQVVEAAPKPPRTAGQRVEDEGDGGSKIAEYLVGQKLI